MPRATMKWLIVMIVVALSGVIAQLDDGPTPAPAPTPAPVGPTPAPAPTPPPNAPTPPPAITPKTPVTPVVPAAPSDDDASGSKASTNGTTPAAKPARTPAPRDEAGVRTAAPEPTLPPVDVDRTVKSEYGTRSPSSNTTEEATQAANKDKADPMSAVIVPAIIGAVIIASVIFVAIFVRNQRRRANDYEGNYDPRGTEAFFEHPRTTNQARGSDMPIMEPIQSKADIKATSSTRTVAVGGALHSPRIPVLNSPKSLADRSTTSYMSSPGSLGASVDNSMAKSTPMTGSSVAF